MMSLRQSGREDNAPEDRSRTSRSDCLKSVCANAKQTEAVIRKWLSHVGCMLGKSCRYLRWWRSHYIDQSTSRPPLPSTQPPQTVTGLAGLVHLCKCKQIQRLLFAAYPRTTSRIPSQTILATIDSFPNHALTELRSGDDLIFSCSLVAEVLCRRLLVSSPNTIDTI